jgi:hypothetical protein
VLDVAQVALQVNVAKEGLRLPGMASKELGALVGKQHVQPLHQFDEPVVRSNRFCARLLLSNRFLQP